MRLFTMNLAHVLAGILWLAINARGFGQCNNTWLAGPLTDQSDGIQDFGIASASVVWTPPNGGPPLLVLGGTFGTIGGVTAHGIAAWDGASWRGLGGTTHQGSSGGSVLGLAVYQGDLIAIGYFDGVGDPPVPALNIARFDGTHWHAMGSGLDGQIPSSFPYGTTLAVLNGELIVGGHFQFAGGVFSPNLAKWNGTTWQAMPGGGVGDPLSIADSVHALLVHSNGVLYVGGYFQTIGLAGSMIAAKNIAQFNPSTQTWASLSTGTGGGTPSVNAIASLGSDVVVAGDFSTAGGAAANHVARWIATTGPAGNWALMGAGVSGGSVLELRNFNGQLFAGGLFTGVVASWNGSTWSTLGGGLTGGVGNQPRVLTLCPFTCLEHGSVLVAAGTFNQAGPVAVNSVAEWDPVAAFWHRMDWSPPVVESLAVLGSRVIIGGAFGQTAQGLPASNVIAWDGGRLESMATGMNEAVTALKSYQVDASHVELVAGGEFTRAGSLSGGSANRIVRWREGPGSLPTWLPMGSGFNGTVLAIDQTPGNQLLGDAIFAGGEFTASGDGATTFNRIATWGGSPASWTPLGSGLNNTVYAIKAFNTGSFSRQVIAGGDFTAAGSTSVSHIAMFPILNLNGWQPMGAGLNGRVHAIERFNNVIYAGGVFTASGATAVNRIASWNGSSWGVVGNGVGFNGAVLSLRVVGSNLYAAGNFTSVDGISANHLAKWNGTSWSAVPGGTEEDVLTIAGYQSELIIGGAFTGLGNPSILAWGLGRYSETGVPWIVQQPFPENIGCEESATFSVVVAPGYPGVQYGWRMNGQPLSDGVTAGGSIVSGSHSETLSIANAGAADEGDYDCVISAGACGNITTAAASLTLMTQCCTADINHSGSVDVSDLLTVIGAWGPCQPPPNPCEADIAPAAHDGIVNVNDLLAIISGWGVCP